MFATIYDDLSNPRPTAFYVIWLILYFRTARVLAPDSTERDVHAIGLRTCENVNFFIVVEE